MSIHRSRSRHVAAALALALTFATLTGCSSSGSNESSDSTTTEATTDTVADETTTTDGSDETTTTDGGTEPTELTQDEADAVLLTAAELGDGWSADGPISTFVDEPDESGLEEALAEQCPGSAEYFVETSGVVREVDFIHDDGYEATLSVNPRPRDIFDQDRLDALIESVDGCEINFDNLENGYEYWVSYRGQISSLYGDRGASLAMAIEVYDGENLIAHFNSYNYGFQVGGASASIRLADGIDDDGNPIEADLDLLDVWAAEIEERLIDAQS